MSFVSMKYLILLCFLLSPLFSSANSFLSFVPIKGGTEYEVSDCDSIASGTIIIPQRFSGKWVTSIGDSAFSGCRNIRSISLPSSLSNIGRAAFHGCAALESISIPSNVQQIRAHTFSECSSLRNLSLPNGLYEIEDNAFENCVSLDSLNLPTNLNLIGDWAFRGCTSITSITLPRYFKHLGQGPFADCHALKSINVNAQNPNFISVDGVLYSHNLETLVQYPNDREPVYMIPSETLYIREFAFRGCVSLKSVTFPENLIRVGTGAFYGCESLVSAIIPNRLKTLGNYVFWGCQSLLEVRLPNGLSHIGKGAFGHTIIEEIRFPDSLERIDAHAFYGCNALREVVIPKSTVFLGDGAFSHCSSLTKATFEGPMPASGINVFAKNNSGESLVVIWHRENEIGWETGFQGLDIKAFVLKWGSFEILSDPSGNYVNSEDWMGWLEVSYKPFVWHIQSGIWLYIEESVASRGSGWICCYENNALSSLQIFNDSDSNWAWSSAIQKWVYLPPSVDNKGPLWIYVVS